MMTVVLRSMGRKSIPAANKLLHDAMLEVINLLKEKRES